MGAGVARRHGLDLAFLWLWCRLAATALIRPLAWEPPYALGTALKRQKKKKRKEEEEEEKEEKPFCLSGPLVTVANSFSRWESLCICSTSIYPSLSLCETHS